MLVNYLSKSIRKNFKNIKISIFLYFQRLKKIVLSLNKNYISLSSLILFL